MLESDAQYRTLFKILPFTDILKATKSQPLKTSKTVLFP